MKIRGNPLSFRHSLRIKFSLTTAAIFLVIFGLASFVLIRQNINFQKQSLLERANTFSNLGTKPIGDSYNSYFQAGFLRFREQLVDTLALNDDITRLQIISVEGDILFDTINLDRQGEDIVNKIEDFKILQAVSSNRPTQLTGKNGDIGEIIVPYSDDFGARPFSIRYFISYQSIYKNIDQTILTIIFLTFLVFVMTMATMVFLVDRAILRPLGKVVSAAKGISQGDLKRKIELNTGDELTDLASSLNQMTQSLQSSIESLKQLDELKDEFVLLASHNLRTPLTVIKSYLSNLQKNQSLDEEAKNEAEKILEGARELDTLTESLINLVSLEKEKQTLSKSRTDLSELIFEVVKELEVKARSREVKIVFKQPASKIPKAFIDKRRIKQALVSLVDNAVKFSPNGKRVIINLDKKDGEILLSISDGGIGISEKERSEVFQKFHRATDILTYNYEGIGLGLYLTKLIIETHQGKIWFESAPQKGTTFYVTLPIESV